MALLRFDKVSFAYPDAGKRALDQVSFSMEEENTSSSVVNPDAADNPASTGQKPRSLRQVQEWNRLLPGTAG
ncbi:MAG: hypothetical protein ACLTI1_06650 [Clostridia bacterium]